MGDRSEQIAKVLTTKKPRVPPIPKENWLSLGATPLNLSVSGRRDGGIAKGMYLWYVGDSSTGKTAHALTAAAQAVVNPNFGTKYRYYYDNVERGNYFDIAKFFPRLAPHLRPPPAHPKNKAVREGHSGLIEEFYYHLDAAVNRGPCIYIVDSMDGLRGEADEAKFAELLGAYGTEKKVTGTYGMAVAQANSRNIKRYSGYLEDSGSILIVINQTRANVVTGPAAMFAPKRKPGQGGHALKFYASCELWATKRGDLRRSVLGRERIYGMRVNIAVEKNRVNGWDGDCTISFARGHGIDEVGSCIDYLVEEKHWKKTDKGVIDAGEFKVKGTREKVAERFNDRDSIRELSKLVEFVWKEIDAKVVVKRFNPYQ